MSSGAEPSYWKVKITNGEGCDYADEYEKEEFAITISPTHILEDVTNIKFDDSITDLDTNVTKINVTLFMAASNALRELHQSGKTIQNKEIAEFEAYNTALFGEINIVIMAHLKTLLAPENPHNTSGLRVFWSELLEPPPIRIFCTSVTPIFRQFHLFGQTTKNSS